MLPRRRDTPLPPPISLAIRAQTFSPVTSSTADRKASISSPPTTSRSRPRGRRCHRPASGFRRAVGRRASPARPGRVARAPGERSGCWWRSHHRPGAEHGTSAGQGGDVVGRDEHARTLAASGMRTVRKVRSISLCTQTTGKVRVIPIQALLSARLPWDFRRVRSPPMRPTSPGDPGRGPRPDRRPRSRRARGADPRHGRGRWRVSIRRVRPAGDPTQAAAVVLRRSTARSLTAEALAARGGVALLDVDDEVEPRRSSTSSQPWWPVTHARRCGGSPRPRRSTGTTTMARPSGAPGQRGVRRRARLRAGRDRWRRSR